MMDIQKWDDLGIKDKSQLIIAYAFAFASIALGFISFILLLYIPASVITMSALWASVTCAILGIGMYFKNSISEIQTKLNNEINKINKLNEEKHIE